MDEWHPVRQARRTGGGSKILLFALKGRGETTIPSKVFNFSQ